MYLNRDMKMRLKYEKENTRYMRFDSVKRRGIYLSACAKDNYALRTGRAT